MKSIPLIVVLFIYCGIICCNRNTPLNDEANEYLKSLEDSAINFKYSDSIIYSKKLDSNIYFFNKKRSGSYAIIRNENDKTEIFKQTLRSENENEIKIDTFSKGIYVIGIYDKSGLIDHRPFVKK